MAGTLNVRTYVGLTDLGHSPPLSVSYTITGVDEFCHYYSDLATVTSIAIDVGAVNVVQSVSVYLITGGTTAATGLSVDLSTATWAATDFVLLQGEMITIRPTGTTFSVKNLNTSTASFEVFVCGDNA